jgi:hypothetical protein
MSGYLEAYGASEERRAGTLRRLKTISIVVVVVVAVGAILYAVFKNHSQEQQAKSFVALLQSHDYPAAYRMWGCTESHPCRDYAFEKFMEDWGPKSAHADQSTASIGLSQTCGSGVVIRMDYKAPMEAVALWVERDSKVLSFAPWAECPGRHLHVGAWLRSLFGR